ncbi:MAG: hypothetical protein ACRD3M_14860, partial [Thermoanaerobaculia bacterium]
SHSDPKEPLGIAYVGKSAGSGFAPESPATVRGRHIHTHEIAHNLGRPHAVHSSQGTTPEGKKKGACGEVAEASTPDFPNWFDVDGQPRATLGPMNSGANSLVFALDSDLMLAGDPRNVFDLMNYCSHPSIEWWPSDFTYTNLLGAINARFAPAPAFSAGIASADFFLVRGRIDLNKDTVELHPFGALIQGPVPDPLPSGDYLLRLRSAAGALLGEISFEPTPMEPLGPDPGLGSFLIGVPSDPAIRKVEIVHGGGGAASRTASANAPTVQVTSPNGGESLTGPTVNLQWTGSDTDGDALTYVVQYSPDNGATWTTLGVDLTSTSIEIPRSSLPASTQGRLRVHASDGFLTAFDTSNGTFTVANNPPFVSLGDPDDGRLYVGDQLVFFDALSFDPEDGNLANSRFSWTSSLDGPLGTDNNFSRKASTLSPGTHLITVTATDGQGAQATDTATIRIATQAAGPLTDLTVAILDPPDPVLVGSSATYTVNANNNGPDPASGVSLTVTATLDPAGPTGPGPATILSAVGAGWSCTPGTGTATCTRAALPALEEAPITVEVAASQAGTLTATAQITGAEEDPATGNNAEQKTTEVEPPSADISVTKTHTPASPLVGHHLTYTITVSNNGPDAATGVTVEDALPAEATFLSASSSQGGCAGTTVVTCDLGSLSSGSQATVTIVVRPTAAVMITNTASVASEQSDPVPGNNQAADVSVTGSNGPFGFYTLTPCRVLDTRLPDGPLGGPALAASADRTFALAGTCGIPATARAVSLNITVTQPSSPGNLRLYPAGTALPLVSSINYRAGQTRANNVTMPLGETGAIQVRCGQLGGAVHFIVDVNGYYE